MVFTKQGTGIAGVNWAAPGKQAGRRAPLPQGVENARASEWEPSACFLGSLLLYTCLRLTTKKPWVSGG